MPTKPTQIAQRAAEKIADHIAVQGAAFEYSTVAEIIDQAGVGELVEALRDSLTALAKNQWGFEHRRCSLCGGWNMGPNGETDRVHTRDCIVGVAIIKGEKLLRRATETQGDKNGKG